MCGYLAFGLLQAGVGTIACWFVFLLGRELIDERTGLVAAALTAVMPTFVGFGALALTETLFAATLLGSLLPLAVLSRSWASSPEANVTRARWPLANLAGISLAIAVYVRPSWLLVAPGFCVLHCLAAIVGAGRSKAGTTGVSGKSFNGSVPSRTALRLCLGGRVACRLRYWSRLRYSLDW